MADSVSACGEVPLSMAEVEAETWHVVQWLLDFVWHSRLWWRNGPDNSTML